jgi:hypothetical protein
VTTLESRCRLLLRVYPATYRQDRGEEIIGTLLDATPAGRSWPLARDVRGLVLGGLRARAALNRQLTTAENLRTAVTVGAAAYLAFRAVNYLTFAVLAFTAPARQAHPAGWPVLVVGTMVGVAVALVWMSSRRGVLLAAAIVAAIAVSLAGSWQSWFDWPITELACLAVVLLLAGRAERPGRGWLWPVALLAAFQLVQYAAPGFWLLAFLALLGAMGIVSLLWVVIDARPAIVVAVFLLALWLPTWIVELAVGPGIGTAVPLLIVTAVSAVAVWRLRRQSATVTAGRGS